MAQKIHERLEELYSQKQFIEKEIAKLENELKNSLRANLNIKLSKSDKINLFESLFVNRNDIYAKKWISKDGLKQSFYPVTQTFKGRDFLPLTHKDLEAHLRGQVQIASYVIDKENKVKFVVFEILSSDIAKLLNSFSLLKANFLFEYSSYNSVFVWLFFETKISAKDSRKFAQYILRKANINAKIYPNKDFSTFASLEEPLELPLHLKFRDNNTTVFFNPIDKSTYKNQWAILQNIKKISSNTIEKYINFETVTNSSFILEDIQIPPFKLDLKLYDFVYIPTKDLSKSFINKLKSFATFDNPQIKILLKLRKPLFNTPKVIKNFEEDEVYLKLPRGLIYKIEEFFNEYNVDYEIDNKTYLEKIETKKVKFDLRDEQQEAIDSILKKDFSICVAPPGFGKTLIGAKMFEQRACTTLIIVNKNMLLSQWIDRFVEYFGYEKKDIGFLGKSKNKLNGQIDVATMQSLKNTPDVINNYSFVIVDECHHIPAVTFEQIVKNFFGRYILGLSATPNRKDGLEPILFQQLGNLAYEYKNKKTVKNHLKVIKTEFTSTCDTYAELINEISRDENRNNLIIEQIVSNKERKILLLTDRIEHINILEEKLLNMDFDFVSIHGSLSKKEQEEKMQLVEEKNLILATTSYFGEGIDFPHLNTIIFATPISYFGRLVQYLGRIGRGNQECLAIDLLDYKNAMLNSAYKKRIPGYKQMHYI
ncbi:TOTE conflict system archaeo-eukaryotic primase domain-containing protein [Halarcobacter sp.]|uniref:TOTE conflict system archaeo-eukaryotic primase domain-containing protein n=1 Tax=Halarcobacter sp. TaxID=2321133 RepID=UPI002AAB28F7|nr:DEAD/DEAH box helicase family protein [Halarcobacter sp.]